MAPLAATVYELERLRCNLCGQVFTAPPAAGVGAAKYDETAAGMVGLLKYGAGLPFNRIAKLQKAMGIPLPAATAWQLVHRAAGLMLPAYHRLIEEAAQGQVLHNDDTTMKVLELCGERQSDGAEDQHSKQRTGVFTSAVVAHANGHRIALFFTGRKHAGENLTELLAHRAAELSSPIQMCDALSRNVPAELKTVLANCLTHARRRFVEVAPRFPDECRYILETLREVYANDAISRSRAMCAEGRLHFHQTESGPLMEALQLWLGEQIEKHNVEPNSGLGEAIGYMRKHWRKLTLFLRVAGAPLDNNICERALKKAILHRKNALFYKTLNGARVGDAFMSLIHPAELGGVDPFPYLVALQRHHRKVAENPSAWMPWNYTQTLARLPCGSDPSP
ncbi:MAG: IS66 family transposase [Dehalococcoidia bacterium]